MRKALQIFAWFAVVLGSITILAGVDDYYAFVGGGLFLAQGILSLCYIHDTDKKLKDK